jgi:hypothetical protein
MFYNMTLGCAKFYQVKTEDVISDRFFKLTKPEMVRYIELYNDHFTELHDCNSVSEGVVLILSEKFHDTRFFQFFEHRMVSLLCSKTNYEWVSIAVYNILKKQHPIIEAGFMQKS